MVNRPATPLGILEELYQEHPQALAILLEHSRAVADFAGSIAQQHPQIDSALIERAAHLHDCGMFLTHAPRIGCFGKAPYLTHGILGARLLEKRDLIKEAHICATHVGVGITATMIKAQKLPLPHQDFTPATLEEEIIAYADCFFSKREGELSTKKPLEKVLVEISRYGQAPRKHFLRWHTKFSL